MEKISSKKLQTIRAIGLVFTIFCIFTECVVYVTTKNAHPGLQTVIMVFCVIGFLVFAFAECWLWVRQMVKEGEK